MPYAEVNGQRLYYEIRGDGEPFVCVMGLGADLTGWSLLVPNWSRQYRTLAFDNRDVGRSSYASAPYEVADMAQDAIALVDELGLERFHLLGMSMGGAIAQEVALALPDRVRTLTLCVSYAGAGRLGRQRARLQVRASPHKSNEELLDELLVYTFSEATYEQPGRIEMLRNLILSYAHPQRRGGFLCPLEGSTPHNAPDPPPALRMSGLGVRAQPD